MRLVIHSQADAGLRRGRGIFCTIGRKLSTFKKVINAGMKKEHPHKLIDTVVNGRAKNSSDKKRKSPPAAAPSTKVRKYSAHTADRLISSEKKRKLPPAAAVTPSAKYSAHTADRLINSGSGIILD